MDENRTRTDAELLALCARGNERALAELHLRHESLCRRRAFDVLRDRELAEEAVQDAFLALWKQAARFDRERAEVRTWLCVLVHRRAVDIVRHRARRLLEAPSEPGPEPGTYTAEELLFLRVERRRVQAAVALLGAKHRQMIELAYWGGLSQSQIAAHCGVPTGTVKSRTHEALARLATLLAGSEPQAA